MAEIVSSASAQSASQYEGKRYRTTNDGAIYLVLDGYASHIQNMDVYNSLFGSSTDFNNVSPEEWQGMGLGQGPDLTAVPGLITAPSGGKIYLIYFGLKRWITNPDTFNKYAFDWDAVEQVDVDKFLNGPDI